MFYQPDARDYMEDRSAEFDYDDLVIFTNDGEILHGMLHHHRSAESRGLVIHFHGNAQNMTSHVMYVKWLTDEGYDVLTFDYRGYGKSSGNPTQMGLYIDGHAVIHHALKLPRYTSKDLFIVAQSLGGAVAIPIVANVNSPRFRGLIIDSSFYSYREVGESKLLQTPIVKYFSGPLSYLVSDDHAPSTLTQKLNLPIFAMHGTEDSVVPYEQGKKLFAALADEQHPQQSFLTLNGGKHTDGMIRPEVRSKILDFLCSASRYPGSCQKGGTLPHRRISQKDLTRN